MNTFEVIKRFEEETPIEKMSVSVDDKLLIVGY